MHKARTFLDVLKEQAIARGFVHTKGRFKGQVHAGDLARFLGMHQPTITRILKGQIVSASNELQMAMVAKFGITADEAMGGAPRYEVREMSPGAASVARRWDGLPPSLQSFIVQQMDAFEQFQQAEPGLAALMFSAPARTEYAEIEQWQAANHKGTRTRKR